MDYIISESQLRKMIEQKEIVPDRVLNKLFTLINYEKKKLSSKKEILDIIRKYTPYLNLPKGYELYLLKLYLLNYREDGDYSSLTKDNFIDPRYEPAERTTNSEASLFTRAQMPFKGSNLEGSWDTDRKGNKYYSVKSYGWYPVYIYKYGNWYETLDKYSSSTGKQMSKAMPYEWNDDLSSKVYLLTQDEMNMIAGGATHDEVMNLKREKLKKAEPELQSKRTTTEKARPRDIQGAPNINIKFKINSIEEEGDKTIVNVDIFDVIKRELGKGVKTDGNYLKGELRNITPEVVEKSLKERLRKDLIKYLGTRKEGDEPQNIEFRFNHLKK